LHDKKFSGCAVDANAGAPAPIGEVPNAARVITKSIDRGIDRLGQTPRARARAIDRRIATRVNTRAALQLMLAMVRINHG
jgi:hypothetical protein